MADFSNDLGRALHYTVAISRERSRQWKTRTRPLLTWQVEVFDSLLAKDGADSIDTAWQKLRQSEETKDQAELLYRELQAIIEFQWPIIDLPYSHNEDFDEDQLIDRPRRRKERPLKKALELMKTFLESVKEVLGGLLDVKWKIALQLAIEATDIFT